jgi:hypothetical protein
MRLAGSAVALAIVLGMTSAVGQPRELSARVRATITAKYPDWRISRLDPAVTQLVRTGQPEGPLNVVYGDFDGNGTGDIAVLIEYTEPSGTRQAQVLALLNDGTRHSMFPLGADRHSSDQYLRLIRRGSRGYDLNTITDFVYERDAIGVEFEGKGGHAWLYRNGQFVAIWTSD